MASYNPSEDVSRGKYITTKKKKENNQDPRKHPINHYQQLRTQDDYIHLRFFFEEIAFQQCIAQLCVFKNKKFTIVTLFEVWPQAASKLKLKNPIYQQPEVENSHISVERVFHEIAQKISRKSARLTSNFS